MHSLCAESHLPGSFFPVGRLQQGNFHPSGISGAGSAPLPSGQLCDRGRAPPRVGGEDVVLMVTELERRPTSSRPLRSPHIQVGGRWSWKKKKMREMKHKLCAFVHVHFSDSYYRLSITSARRRLPWEPALSRLQPHEEMMFS